MASKKSRKKSSRKSAPSNFKGDPSEAVDASASSSVSTDNVTVGEVLKRMNGWKLDPIYQRKFGAWSKKMKADFIKSVYLARDLGAVTLVEGQQYQHLLNVADGRHRLGTLDEWVHDKFSIPMILGPEGPKWYRYSHLMDTSDVDAPDYLGKINAQRVFAKRAKFSVHTHEHMSLENQARLFESLNSQKPVTPAELCFGIHGYLQLLIDVFYQIFSEELGPYLTKGIRENDKANGWNVVYKSLLVAFGPELTGQLDSDIDLDSRELTKYARALNRYLKLECRLQLSAPPKTYEELAALDGPLGETLRIFTEAAGILRRAFALYYLNNDRLDIKLIADLLSVLCAKISDGVVDVTPLTIQKYVDWVGSCVNSARSLKEHSTSRSIISQRITAFSNNFSVYFP